MMEVNPQAPKKIWKEPVLHQQGIETTAGGPIADPTDEDTFYHPASLGSTF
jgi:hypothetical protein